MKAFLISLLACSSILAVPALAAEKAARKDGLPPHDPLAVMGDARKAQMLALKLLTEMYRETDDPAAGAETLLTAAGKTDDPAVQRAARFAAADLYRKADQDDKAVEALLGVFEIPDELRVWETAELSKDGETGNTDDMYWGIGPIEKTWKTSTTVFEKKLGDEEAKQLMSVLFTEEEREGIEEEFQAAIRDILSLQKGVVATHPPHNPQAGEICGEHTKQKGSCRGGCGMGQGRMCKPGPAGPAGMMPGQMGRGMMGGRPMYGGMMPMTPPDTMLLIRAMNRLTDQVERLGDRLEALHAPPRERPGQWGRGRDKEDREELAEREEELDEAMDHRERELREHAEMLERREREIHQHAERMERELAERREELERHGAELKQRAERLERYGEELRKRAHELELREVGNRRDRDGDRREGDRPRERRRDGDRLREEREEDDD